MISHGPKGIQSLDDVAKMGSLLASRDMVAADAAAAKLFGQTPKDVRYIRLAAEKGLGRMDIEKLNIKKIYL
jgi:uncharacterized protein (DUF362 family)